MAAAIGNKYAVGNNGGRPPKYDDNKLLSAKIDEYFNWCDSQKEVITNQKGQTQIIYKPYTVLGLCLYLDISRETLCEYQKLEKFSDTITRAKNRIELWLEEKSLIGVTNPQVSMFNLKNNFGWKDKTEQDVNHSGEVEINVNIVDE